MLDGGADLRGEAGHQALPQLAQDDPILQGGLEELLRVRYVLLGRAEHPQRDQPGHRLLLWVHGSADRSSPKHRAAGGETCPGPVPCPYATHPHFCFNFQKKKKKSGSGGGGGDVSIGASGDQTYQEVFFLRDIHTIYNGSHTDKLWNTWVLLLSHPKSEFLSFETWTLGCRHHPGDIWGRL